MENQEKEVVRPLHELYELLLESCENDFLVLDLLNSANALMRRWELISINEMIVLQEHIIDSDPPKNIGCNAGFTMDNLDFIRKMIEITKPKQQ